ncbi:hypothetical protein TNCV_5136281 [Trichonephila clavipes]|nr:hypothetical protein TNCV_5136281 [Trichonephila clavipes]
MMVASEYSGQDRERLDKRKSPPSSGAHERWGGGGPSDSPPPLCLRYSLQVYINQKAEIDLINIIFRRRDFHFNSLIRYFSKVGKPIDKYSACVEVGKPIDENPACVEVGTNSV